MSSAAAILMDAAKYLLVILRFPVAKNAAPVSRTRHGHVLTTDGGRFVFVPTNTKMFYRTVTEPVGSLGDLRLSFGRASTWLQRLLSRAPALSLRLLFGGTVQRHTDNQVVHHVAYRRRQIPLRGCRRSC